MLNGRNLSIAVEFSMNAKGSVTSYDFITSKIEGLNQSAEWGEERGYTPTLLDGKVYSFNWQ